MLDTRLVGYWSDKNLSQGSMEAADIAFRPDGRGWVYWSNFGGGFHIMRFRWYLGDRRRLTLDVREELSGRWYRDRRSLGTGYRVSSKQASGPRIVLGYEVREGQDVLGRPATLLETDQPISLGTIGARFALERQLSGDEQDPVARRSSRRSGAGRRSGPPSPRTSPGTRR